MGAKTAEARTAGHANDDILKNLQRYKTEGEAMLERIVTGDETWVHHYQPERKQASRQWKHKELPTPIKFKVVPSAKKMMTTVFWDERRIAR